MIKISEKNASRLYSTVLVYISYIELIDDKKLYVHFSPYSDYEDI